VNGIGNEGGITKNSLADVGRLVPLALEQAPRIRDTMVRENIACARRHNSDATPAEVIRNLERSYLSTLTRRGAAVGALSAAPGDGSGAALQMGGVLSMLELTTLFARSLAIVHGIPRDDLERRSILVMGITLGGSGSSVIPTVARRTGKHWGREFVDRVPGSTLKPINDVLGNNFVTKYGTKEGVIVLGHVAPIVFGAVIGGGANAVLGWSVIQAFRRAFGPAPDAWPTEGDGPPTAVAA
jgi:hypothetical protein